MMRAGGGPGGFSIAVVLTAVMGLVLVLALIVVLLAGYRIARSNTAELIREKAELIMRSIEDRVQSHLDPVHAQLTYLAKIIERDRLDLSRRDKLETLLLGSLAAVPQVSAIALVSPDLQVLRVFRSGAGTRISLRDWSDDPGFEQTMADVRRASGPYWGTLFVAEGAGATFINLFTPISFGEHFDGALIAGVSIRQLSDFIGQLGKDEPQTTFILHGTDSVLAHPRLEQDFPGLNDDRPLPSLGELGDPVLAKIWSDDRLFNIESDFANGVQARVVEISDKAYVFLFRELLDYGKQPWLIGTYLRLGDVAPQFQRLTLLGWMGLMTILAALLVAFLLGQSLSSPIRRLATAATRVRNLDFEQASTLPRGPFRELNEVAEAHDAMVDGLRLFATYVPRSLVRRLVNQEGGHEVVSEEREVTVLFTDLVGFTTFAEDLPASEVADLLNEHFTLVGECVEREDGTLDKFIGDSMMVFWGAPIGQPDQADRACRAATGIARAMRDQNARRSQAARPPLQIRVGIHTGQVVVGNIGARSRVNYTIIGDAVNTTQRLEELARTLADLDQDCYTLVSVETAKRVKGEFPLKYVGRHALRGRHEPLAVYRLEAE